MYRYYYSCKISPIIYTLYRKVFRNTCVLRITYLPFPKYELNGTNKPPQFELFFAIYSKQEVWTKSSKLTQLLDVAGELRFGIQIKFFLSLILLVSEMSEKNTNNQLTNNHKHACFNLVANFIIFRSVPRESTFNYLFQAGTTELSIRR